MRNRTPGVFFLFLMLSCGAASGYDEAEAERMRKEMEKYRYEMVTTKEGLSFKIPSDMPIDRKDGLVTPVPYEEYLYVKFKMIEERQIGMNKNVDELKDSMKSLHKKTDELLKLLETIAKQNSPAKAEPATTQ